MAYPKPNYNSNLPAENERIFSAAGMSNETSPSPLSKAQNTKDSYWFAHGRAGDASPVVNDPKAGGDVKDQQVQKDKEEKIRQFREMQEEERVKRMRDLEQQFQQAKKHREQQEEERRRRIEEARVKEIERRQQVEERKRQIWEAEQERKEAILRRNMEREARIEARRNAQRNSQSYVFGSSTPRSFDLDLAAIGRSVNAGCVLMSSVSRRSEERELGPPPRATSACSLDRKFENVSNDAFLLHNDQPDYFRSSSLSPMPSRVSYLSKQIALQHKSSNDMKACLSMWSSNVQSRPNFFDSPSSGWLVGSGVLVGEDCMSRSMVSLSSSAFRGRKRTDITPTLTRERSITPHITPRGNGCMRAVSMTRLDQLAQPRRTYRSYATGTTTNEGPRTVSPSMSKSMCNLANSAQVGRKAYTPMSSKGGVARSMLHLADSPQRENRGLTPSPTMPKSGMRSAQSMMHLAAPPRLTRAARLRAEALAGNRTVSAWNINKDEGYQTSSYLSPAGKDTSRSPSRPQSSMSGTSELSTASSSAVNMRHRPAPRRPRPYSVHGSMVDSSTVSAHITRKEPERPARLSERNTHAPKPERAKSASRENSEIKSSRPLTAPKKPVPPPKPVDMAAKAKPHPVPIKDNLRKRGKPSSKPVSDENKVPLDKNEKPAASSEKKNEQENAVVTESKEDSATADTKPGSEVTSPTTDSDMMVVSSDDSKISAIMGSELDTLSQSVTESDRFVQESTVASLSESQNASTNVTNNESEISDANNVQSIPIMAQQESETPPQAQPTDTPIVAQPTEVKAEVPPAVLQQKAAVPTPQKEAKVEMPAQMQTSFSENMPVSSKPRITSEEEAKVALAEKRRLAREQAEREAELERQRLEEIRRQEEEQRRLEEEEQRRMEEEQIRLAELHRQIEQEKLAKAIEEQRQREKEEQEKREEEARQKAEREEQEKKAREEAEKQRLELQEKLRKEEEERAERKKRVEQIMARTRGRAATTAQSPSNPPSAQNADSSSFAEMSKSTGVITNGVKDPSLGKSTSFNGTSENGLSKSFCEQVSNPLPDILNSENIAKSNGTESKTSVSNNGFDLLSSRTLSANEDLSPQTNGYSSHEEMSCTTSPEESADVGLLIDIQSSQQRSYKSESADFTKLVDVQPTSLDNNVNNENYLINVDDVNSNLFNSGNPFDSLQKKQDTSVTTDLLS